MDRTGCTVDVRRLAEGESLIDEEGRPTPPTFSFSGRYCRDEAARFGGAISSAVVGSERAAAILSKFRAEHVLSSEDDKAALAAIGSIIRVATIDYESVEAAKNVPAEEAVLPTPALEPQPLA